MGVGGWSFFVFFWGGEGLSEGGGGAIPQSLSYVSLEKVETTKKSTGKSPC